MSGPVVTRCQYLATYDAWFWTVEAPNPTPVLMPDGIPSRLDSHLIDTGCSHRSKIGSPTRRRDRDIARAKRKIARRVALGVHFGGDVR